MAGPEHLPAPARDPPLSRAARPARRALGAGAGPGAACSPHPPRPPPTRTPWGPGRPASLRPRGSLPGSRLPSPGSILSRRSGEGVAGGGRLHGLPEPAGRTAGDPAGLREGPARRGRAAAVYPAPPGLRASGAAIGPDGRGRLGLAVDARGPRPRECRQRAGPPVSPSVGAPAARRAGVRTARLLCPPPPPGARWLLPRLPACRLNSCLAARRRSGSPAPGSPAPSLAWGARGAVFDRPRRAQLVEESPPEGVRSCSGTLWTRPVPPRAPSPRRAPGSPPRSSRRPGPLSAGLGRSSLRENSEIPPSLLFPDSEP